MARRRCQYCTEPLGRLRSLLRYTICPDCGWRMSMGGSPRRPPTEPTPPTT